MIKCTFGIRLFFILLLIFFISSNLNANTIDEFSIAEKSLKEVNKEISKEKKDLNSLRKTKKSLANNLSTIQNKIGSQKKQLVTINKKIKKLKIKQKEIATEINNIQRSINIMKTSIKRTNTYIINNKGIIELKILLFSKTYHETIKNMELVEHINKKIYTRILWINKKSNEVIKLKNELDMKMSELKKIINMKRNVIDEYRAEKIRYNQTLVLIKNDETDAKEYLKMLKTRKKSLDSSFKKLRKKIYKKEGGTKFLTSNFFKSKGKLMWPIDGTVIEHFGPRKLKGFKGTIFNKGIKIKADDTGYVHTIYAGTVKYMDQVRGYGNIIIVNHDKFFYTLYANIDEIFVKLNQKLEKGDKLGLIDVDLNAIKPYLYFEIRKQDTAVDPLLWLQK